MGKISIGDIVGRKSYQMDIFFKVVDIVGEGPQARALLKGLDVRLCADAPLADLEPVPWKGCGPSARSLSGATRDVWEMSAAAGTRKGRSCSNIAMMRELMRPLFLKYPVVFFTWTAMKSTWRSASIPTNNWILRPPDFALPKKKYTSG